ncbi:unnamed protein product [Cylicocyclus nassatus]|uniref:Uncharacterized protein n=1 Tax=Cylicocyclus nassatus TaxID=53992 RepID=A0AA36H8P9_CYLNA|nr:unnamed protein product [Cylicocyclus nassatus]
MAHPYIIVSMAVLFLCAFAKENTNCDDKCSTRFSNRVKEELTRHLKNTVLCTCSMLEHADKYLKRNPDPDVKYSVSILYTSGKTEADLLTRIAFNSREVVKLIHGHPEAVVYYGCRGQPRTISQAQFDSYFACVFTLDPVSMSFDALKLCETFMCYVYDVLAFFVAIIVMQDYAGIKPTTTSPRPTVSDAWARNG